MPKLSAEDRLQRLEDHIEICQLVSGYGYAVDGLNAEAVGSLYAEKGVYAVGDVGKFEGREAVAAITSLSSHLDLVRQGCAHMSTPPYVVIDGDRAIATCHTLVLTNAGEKFEVLRLSASRLQLSRGSGGNWQIDHRQNYMLQGDPEGPALLGRVQQGPPAL